MLDFTDQASVVLYKWMGLVKELKLNAKESDNEHWFEFDGMTYCPWTDIDTEPQNLFTISRQRINAASSSTVNMVVARTTLVGW